MTYNGRSINDVPKYIRSAWTDEQRAFMEATYDRQRLGPEWITAHRCVEMQSGDRAHRAFLLGYYPEEALFWLERFKETHFDAEPDKGHNAMSSVALRVKRFYPELFTMDLRPRMQPLEGIADTHPYAHHLYARFQSLDASYHRKLAAALELTSDLSSGERRDKLHELYKLAFFSVYSALRALLMELAASH